MTLLGLLLAGGLLSKVLTGLLIAVHFLLCIFLIAVVLLQSGRAGDLSSAFGGAPSQANIAAMSSENILTRATKVCAFGFMVTSLLLALFAHGESSSDSVLDRVPEPAAAAAPADTGAEAATTEPEGAADEGAATAADESSAADGEAAEAAGAMDDDAMDDGAEADASNGGASDTGQDG